MLKILKVCSLILVPWIAANGMEAQDVTPAPDEFHVGDRIALKVDGPLVIEDTVIVREGSLIQIPNIGEVSVQGVRRSNVQQYLTEEISKYVKEPVVTAVPLVRIAVIGAVTQPGYYSVRSDMILSDILMRAGGLLPTADINRSSVKRSGKEIMDKKAVTNAFSSHMTFDQLRLAPGDQIIIGDRQPGRMDNVLKFSGLLLGVAGVAVALTR